MDRVVHATTLFTNAPIERRGHGPALVAKGIESLSICFLQSFANPARERAAALLNAGRYPGLILPLQRRLAANPRVRPQLHRRGRASSACTARVPCPPAMGAAAPSRP